jgi:glutamate dehydrogenase (NAD(P)+)
MTPGPYLQVSWQDPVTGRRGYLVIDRLVRGVAGGGLRMRDGCTMAEVSDLARAMSLKEAVVYQPGDRYTPLGGAKGGIDCDPYDPAAQGVLDRYVEAMRPLLAAHWGTGEDLGLRQEDIDRACHRAGLSSSIDSVLALLDDPEDGLRRIEQGFAVDVDGISLGDMVGGYGVAEVTFALLRRLGRPPEETRGVVQGFGSIGGAGARYLSRAGVRVVAICDVRGVVLDPNGLDVETLLRARDPHGAIDRAALPAGCSQLPREEWLSIDAEVLVPAATSYVLTEENCDQVRAQVVVQGANVAATPEAEERLAARGVSVIPDFVANLATNAWWWWTVFGDIPPATEPALRKIEATMHRLVDEVFARVERDRVLPRQAAEAIAHENLAQLDALEVAAPAN